MSAARSGDVALLVVCFLSIALPLVTAASFTTGMSQSKLSVHAGGFSVTTQSILSEGRPRVVKFLDTFGGTPTAAKALDPGVVIVGRIYLPNQPQTGDPVAAAWAWWGAVNNTVLTSSGVDYWEGYNEPGVGDLASMQWYTTFEVTRVGILSSHNLKAAVGCFATGTPDVTQPDIMNAFAPAIDAARQYNGVLAVHEYSSPYMWGCFSNQTNDGWLTGRYRKWYNEFLIPQNRSLPLIITECGIDAIAGCGGPPFGGYQTACTWWEEQGWSSDCDYNSVSQLKWYDSILRQDDYVIGATIFQIDCPGWEDYDVTPAAPDLIAYLQSQQT